MSEGLLDSIYEASEENSPIDPPWLIWKKAKKEREDWFKHTRSIMEKISEQRIMTFANNLLWYTGEYERTQEYRLVIPGRTEEVVPRKLVPRIFNHLYDITEQRVAILSRFKPSFDVVPANEEQNDKRVAKLIKFALDAVDRRVQIDLLAQEIERWVAVWGEAYAGIEWNKNIGDRIKRGSVARVGDVDIYLKEPWSVFLEPKRAYSRVSWALDIEDICHIEEARKRFSKSNLEPDKATGVFEFDSSILQKRPEEVVIYRLIQLPNQYCENGIVAFFINGELVHEEEKYPYSHNEFPWERHTDIDVPGRLYPMSFYQHLRPIQHSYNRLTGVMMRNLMLTAHPHIMNPTGSGVKREAFGNAPTEIRYRPVNGLKPEIITFSSVPKELFEMRDTIKQEMGQVAGSQNALRGNPPAGTRAASMLRWFEEQQEMRMGTQVAKHNEINRRIHWKAASVIGDYYPAGDQDRLIRVLGKDNQYIIKAFQRADKIASEVDVIILNSTGFSRTMSGRLEEISLISQIEQQSGQQIMSPQEKAEVLEAKNPQKAYDILTNSYKTADWFIELMSQGEEVSEPQPYWDLITHWRRTVTYMNSPTWAELPDDVRNNIEDHLSMLEDLMARKAKANQTFAMKCDALEGYPALWSVEPTIEPKQPQAPQPQAAPPSQPQGAPSIQAPGAPPEGVVPGNMPM